MVAVCCLTFELSPVFWRPPKPHTTQDRGTVEGCEAKLGSVADIRFGAPGLWPGCLQLRLALVMISRTFW